MLSRRMRKVEATETSPVAESYTPLISKGVEFTPTANTNFRQDETLFTYFEIYDSQKAGSPGEKTQAHLRILDSNSGAVVTTFDPVDTETYRKPDSSTIAMARGIVLRSFPVGTYRLEVRAKDAAGGTTEWQTADFTVEPAKPREESISLAPKKREVILNVTALDEDGRPVTNLTSTEFQIFEDDKPQFITSFKQMNVGRTPGAPHPPIVILFDMLNTVPRQREYIASQMIEALQPLETDEGIYLYILTNEGQLYFVGGPNKDMQAAATAQGTLSGKTASAAKPADATPWTQQIQSLLHQAINKVYGFRTMEYRDISMRAVTTFNRLGTIGEEMAYVQGPKTILWVTSGVPNSIE